jgi:AraC-like DNA-binding protein
MDTSDPSMAIRRQAVVCEFFAHIVSLRRAGEGARHPHSKTVAAIREYIDQHYNETIVVKEFADQFGISYSHLRTVFSEQTGMSIKAYIRHRRVQNAKELLAAIDHPIKHVARMVGYDDECYFMRLFKEMTGMTAGRFRQLHSHFPPPSK